MRLFFIVNSLCYVFVFYHAYKAGEQSGKQTCIEAHPSGIQDKDQGGTK